MIHIIQIVERSYIMSVIKDIRERAAQYDKTIVLPEGNDDRIIEAAARLQGRYCKNYIAWKCGRNSKKPKLITGT